MEEIGNNLELESEDPLATANKAGSDTSGDTRSIPTETIRDRPEDLGTMALNAAQVDMVQEVAKEAPASTHQHVRRFRGATLRRAFEGVVAAEFIKHA